MNPTTLVKSPRRKTGDTYAFPDIGTPAWREIYTIVPQIAAEFIMAMMEAGVAQ